MHCDSGGARQRSVRRFLLRRGFEEQILIWRFADADVRRRGYCPRLISEEDDAAEKAAGSFRQKRSASEVHAALEAPFAGPLAPVCLPIFKALDSVQINQIFKKIELFRQEIILF